LDKEKSKGASQGLIGLTGERLSTVRHDKAALFSLIVCIILFALIIYSLVVRVQMLSLNISLWNDEAMLAENVVGKDWAQMLTPPLTNMQTAPVFYLIVVKAFTFLFGTSEWVLRLYSFISLILLLLVQGALLRKVYRVSYNFVFFSVALSSVFYYFIKYSAEFKPYMGDALFSVVVILMYWLYRKDRIGPVLLGVLFSVCMLFSTPSAFFAAGVVITEFVVALIRRDRRSALRIVLAGGIFLVVFVLNYVFWLRSIAEDSGMVWYWHNRRFDFRFWDPAAFSHNAIILKDLFEPFYGIKYLAIVLAVCGAVVSLAKRSIYTLSVLVSFAILLIASTLSKYPLMNRLWMFLFVWIFIFIFVFLSSLRVRIPGRQRAERVTTMIVTLIIAVVLIVPNYKFADYGKGATWTLTPGNQVNPLISYVQENIEPGEKLFSYHVANTVLKYKIGYHTNRIGNVSEDNVLWGSGDPLHYKDSFLKKDVSRIVKTGGAYVLFYHSYKVLSGDPYVDLTIGDLQKAGYMDLVLDVDHTPLYWFTDDLSKVKAGAALDAFDLTAENGTISGTFQVTNTGKTVLQKGGYGALSLVLRKVGDPESQIVSVAMNRTLLPGESDQIWIEAQNLPDGMYETDLICRGEYAFSEIGIPPMQIQLS